MAARRFAAKQSSVSSSKSSGTRINAEFRARVPDEEERLLDREQILLEVIVDDV